jgi:hypothetical protein
LHGVELVPGAEEVEAAVFGCCYLLVVLGRGLVWGEKGRSGGILEVRSGGAFWRKEGIWGDEKETKWWVGIRYVANAGAIESVLDIFLKGDKREYILDQLVHQQHKHPH